MWNDRLQITEEEIVDGQSENPRCCAVALAVLRQIIPTIDDEEPLEAYVDGDGFVSIRIKDSYHDRYIVMRKNKEDYDPIYDFITAFDDGDDVEPFEWDCKVEKAPYPMRNRGEYKAKEMK